MGGRVFATYRSIIALAWVFRRDPWVVGLAIYDGYGHGFGLVGKTGTNGPSHGSHGSTDADVYADGKLRAAICNVGDHDGGNDVADDGPNLDEL